MFCQKCGTKLSQGARFCAKCGEKVALDDVAHAEPITHQIQDAPTNLPKKNKLKKLPLILGAVVLIIIIIALNWEENDYVMSVKVHKPFNVQGLPYTYGEVFNKYIVSPKWEVRKDGDIYYVNISGTVKGSDSKIKISIKVSEHPDDPNMLKIVPASVRIDDMRSTTQDEAVRVLFNMFWAYDEGFESLVYP